jgi:hypothetical protein
MAMAPPAKALLPLKTASPLKSISEFSAEMAPPGPSALLLFSKVATFSKFRVFFSPCRTMAPPLPEALLPLKTASPLKSI